MDIPNAGSHISVTKKGYLQKHSSRSFPYIPHPWKRKYCVLVKGQLFYYEKEDSKGVDKGSGVINLEYYDQVVEAPAKECKKATNVFVLTSQDRSFFDPGRHLFSAESPKDLQEWMRLLKKAIEQIRNNNRAAGAGAAGSFLKPSTPRGGGPKGVAAKTEAKGPGRAEGGAAGGKDKGKKKDGVEEEVENKENLEDWTNSKDRKQKYSESSLRRRKGNPSSRSMDESSLATADSSNKGGGTNSIGRKKASGGNTDTEPNSGHSSLGRKLKPGKSGKSGGQVDAEGMMFGSLGRNSKVEASSNKGSASGVSGDSGSGGSGNVERRKRKADDDGYGEDGGALETPESGPQLESVTKHRVKGPAGRRMPQNRRTQHLMMKQRASSLSALAHNADNPQCQDNPAARLATLRQPSTFDTVLEGSESTVEHPETPKLRVEQNGKSSGVEKNGKSCGDEKNGKSCGDEKKGGSFLGDDLKESVRKRAEFRVSNLMEEVLGKLSSNGEDSKGSDRRSGGENHEDRKSSQVSGGDPDGTEDKVNLSSNNINNNRSACNNRELVVERFSNGRVNPSSLDCFACRCCSACRDATGRCFCDNTLADESELKKSVVAESLTKHESDIKKSMISDSLTKDESDVKNPEVSESLTKTTEDCEGKKPTDGKPESKNEENESESKIDQDESKDGDIETGSCNNSEIKDSNDTASENGLGQSENKDDVISKENDKNNTISADTAFSKGNCSKCGIELKKSVVVDDVKPCNGTEKIVKSEESARVEESEKVQLRKGSHSSNADPTARIETLNIDTFDDIDDALFFKSSRIMFDDIQTSNGKEETSGGKTPKSKKGKPKKRVTMDANSIQKSSRSDSDASKSRLSRFRKTLTSFRRIRLRSDGNLADEHPDEVADTSKSSYCVIL